MDNPSDIFSLCRLCLVKDQVNISIFDEQGDIRQIFLKISSCLPVKVSRDDKLPKKICDDCSNKLDLLYEFWNSSANAEKTLLSWLGQAGVKDAGSTINAVAQQIAKPAETLVKLESGIVDENSVLISPPPVNNVDNASFNDIPKEESEAPPPAKRTRRSAAVKAQINIIPESEDDDDMDTTDLPTKLEDGTEDSDGEDKDPSYTEVSGTSVNDQPGPSGVGKVGGVEAPMILQILRVTKVEIQPGQSLCPKCGKIFKEKEYLRRHIIRVHQLKPTLKCEICNRLFKTSLNLNSHMRVIHEGKRKTELCDICEKRFKNIKTHKERVHLKTNNTKTALCDLCGKRFQDIEIHRKTVHLKDFNFYCELCGKGFLYRHPLEQHIKIKHEKCLFSCTEKGCLKKFSSKHSVRYHLQAAHNKEKRDYLCTDCGKNFTNPTLYRRHLTKHLRGRKLFSCDICKKKVTTLASLKVHMRIHTGERPFNCEQCKKSFITQKNLKTHLVVHTKATPFECKKCDKKFTQRGTLTIHIRKCHT